jgi:hypothetical protein
MSQNLLKMEKQNLFGAGLLIPLELTTTFLFSTALIGVVKSTTTCDENP